MRIILIAGYGRSGSTLLEGLLSSQVNSVAVGELKYLFSRGYLRNELCSCRTPINNCTFWSEVKNANNLDYVQVERIEGLRRRVERHSCYLKYRVLRLPSAKYRRDRLEYMAVLKKIYRSVDALTGGATIIDSSKDPAHIDLLLELFPDCVHVIHLSRDPRAVAYSFATPKIRPEVHWAEEYMGTRSLITACRDWSFIELTFIFALRKLRACSFVNYSDLATSPRSTIDNVISQVGMARSTDSISARSHSHSVSGNPMRFGGTEGISWTDIRVDERWRTKYPAVKSLLVLMLTFPVFVLRRFFRKKTGENIGLGLE